MKKMFRPALKSDKPSETILLCNPFARVYGIMKTDPKCMTLITDINGYYNVYDNS